MNFADKHNFGKSVDLVRRASETWFRKPRTVYWENLFFGKKSPLAEIFDTVGPNGSMPLSAFLFNLDLENENEWCGYSRGITATGIKTPTALRFYGFGVLLAYTYIFGIRDLHKENLIMTDTHLQAVDVEVVFTNLVLPSETLLLPFKTFGYSFVGIGSLAPSAKDFKIDEIRNIFAGYFDLFRRAQQNKDKIARAFSALQFSQHPCRVIVRNTSEYAQYIKGEEKLSLLTSEKTQIDRQDIPYYFKYPGQKDLFWLSKPGVSSVETNLGIFQEDIDRHAMEPTALLEINLSTDRKMIQGAMQLVKHFSSESQSLSIDLNGDISVQSQDTRIILSGTHYATS